VKATLRRSGAAARSASALDAAAAKPNANGDPSTDNAIRREIIPDVILPIMSASKLMAILGSTYADGIYAIWRIMGELFGPSPSSRGKHSGGKP
jgi:hypothetical protein